MLVKLAHFSKLNSVEIEFIIAWLADEKSLETCVLIFSSLLIFSFKIFTSFSISLVLFFNFFYSTIVLDNLFLSTNILISEDLPTFDLPKNTYSGKPVLGHSSSLELLFTNVASLIINFINYMQF